MMGVDDALLVGCDTQRLVQRADDHRLLAETSAAFSHLASDASAAGFDLQIASAHRSFERQLAIWNAKATGGRSVTDPSGASVDLDALPIQQRIEAILRFSALPGASRHHWGTDIDVFDAAAMPAHYRVALTPDEAAPGGVFAALHSWLDKRIEEGRSYGFYRPYDSDRGGVAAERWHLSYAPLAVGFERRLSPGLLRRCWSQPQAATLCWRELLQSQLEALVERYVHNVAAPPWPL